LQNEISNSVERNDYNGVSSRLENARAKNGDFFFALLY